MDKTPGSVPMTIVKYKENLLETTLTNQETFQLEHERRAALYKTPAALVIRAINMKTQNILLRDMGDEYAKDHHILSQAQDKRNPNIIHVGHDELLTPEQEAELREFALQVYLHTGILPWL